MTTAYENNKRIAKNTVYLYIRQIIVIIVSLYTSRIILRVLGASDYGLYGVVAGVLTMFGMFRGTLQIGTQRFLSVALAEGDENKLRRTFSTAWGVHVFISVALLLLMQTVGLWFVINYLNIPEGRMNAAIWVYELSFVSFIANLLQLPFQSCIIAHEHMKIYAIMSIYDVIMKLVMILLIQFISYDKLILYSILLFAISMSSIVIYNYYCRKHFAECNFKIVKDKKLTKEIATYCGWNLLGGSIGPLTNQGLNILLNIFFGTVVNAARTLSTIVNTYIMQFVSNFQLAANPQIVKLFASREYKLFYDLIINNCRVAVYLFLLIAAPAFLEIEFVLKVWLGDYPKYTDIFLQIVLIQSFFQTLNKPINMSIHASGNIKWLNISNTICMLVTFPVCYFVLKLGYSPIVIYWINLLFFVSDSIICLYYSNRYTKLPVKTILTRVYLNAFVGTFFIFFPPYIVSIMLEEGLQRFIIVCGTSIIAFLLTFYYWGSTPEIKKMVLAKFNF